MAQAKEIANKYQVKTYPANDFWHNSTLEVRGQGEAAQNICQHLAKYYYGKSASIVLRTIQNVNKYHLKVLRKNANGYTTKLAEHKIAKLNTLTAKLSQLFVEERAVDNYYQFEVLRNNIIKTIDEYLKENAIVTAKLNTTDGRFYKVLRDARRFAEHYEYKPTLKITEIDQGIFPCDKKIVYNSAIVTDGSDSKAKDLALLIADYHKENTANNQLITINALTYPFYWLYKKFSKDNSSASTNRYIEQLNSYNKDWGFWRKPILNTFNFFLGIANIIITAGKDVKKYFLQTYIQLQNEFQSTFIYKSLATPKTHLPESNTESEKNTKNTSEQKNNKLILTPENIYSGPKTSSNPIDIVSSVIVGSVRTFTNYAVDAPVTSSAAASSASFIAATFANPSIAHGVYNFYNNVGHIESAGKIGSAIWATATQAHITALIINSLEKTNDSWLYKGMRFSAHHPIEVIIALIVFYESGHLASELIPEFEHEMGNHIFGKTALGGKAALILSEVNANNETSALGAAILFPIKIIVAILRLFWSIPFGSTKNALKNLYTVFEDIVKSVLGLTLSLVKLALTIVSAVFTMIFFALMKITWKSLATIGLTRAAQAVIKFTYKIANFFGQINRAINGVFNSALSGLKHLSLLNLFTMKQPLSQDDKDKILSTIQIMRESHTMGNPNKKKESVASQKNDLIYCFKNSISDTKEIVISQKTYSEKFKANK